MELNYFSLLLSYLIHFFCHNFTPSSTDNRFARSVEIWRDTFQIHEYQVALFLVHKSEFMFKYPNFAE
jgi:hypothetical protein